MELCLDLGLEMVLSLDLGLEMELCLDLGPEMELCFEFLLLYINDTSVTDESVSAFFLADIVTADFDFTFGLIILPKITTLPVL